MQGLLLVNLGTPTSPTKNDIEKFILDFMGDPNVVTMPQWMWKPLLKHVILPIHIKKSIISYQKIWSQNGSPLRFYTEKITQQVQALLPDWQVKMAMTYGDPSINTTIQEMKNNGCDHLVLLPLYPQYANCTVKTIIATAKQTCSNLDLPLTIIKHFCTNNEYLQILVKDIQHYWSLDKYDHLYISYHGIPQSAIKKGDIYLKDCTAQTQAMCQMLNIPSEKIAMVFQSKCGLMPWLKPYLNKTLIQAAKDGMKKVLIVTPSFVTDCSETIAEDAIDNKNLFIKYGGENLTVVPPMNDSPAFAKFIANLATNVNKTKKG